MREAGGKKTRERSRLQISRAGSVQWPGVSSRCGYIFDIYLICRLPILFLTKVTSIDGGGKRNSRSPPITRVAMLQALTARSTACYEVSITSKNWIATIGAAGLAAILSR